MYKGKTLSPSMECCIASTASLQPRYSQHCTVSSCWRLVCIQWRHSVENPAAHSLRLNTPEYKPVSIVIQNYYSTEKIFGMNVASGFISLWHWAPQPLPPCHLPHGPEQRGADGDRDSHSHSQVTWLAAKKQAANAGHGITQLNIIFFIAFTYLQLLWKWKYPFYLQCLQLVTSKAWCRAAPTPKPYAYIGFHNLGNMKVMAVMRWLWGTEDRR